MTDYHEVLDQIINHLSVIDVLTCFATYASQEGTF